jgi:GNAT superfamily N-acetyltransferase
VQVRPYEPHDASGLALLLGELGYPATTAQAAEYAGGFAAHAGATLLVAVEDGAVVGAAGGSLVPRLDAERLSCRITELVVAASSRRQGIGRALIAAIEARAREAGAVRLDVSTGDWRTDAHAFYERLGFSDNARALVRRLG